jgi:hypothetical protein
VLNENKEGEVLVFNVKEGWAPLCKFLNVDIPQHIPFANVNDTNEFQRKILFAKSIGLCTWTVVDISSALLVYFIVRIMYNKIRLSE